MERREDFRDLLAEFGAEKVEFLVIGGYAVAHYDRPRYAKDIDLWPTLPKEKSTTGADEVLLVDNVFATFARP